MTKRKRTLTWLLIAGMVAFVWCMREMGVFSLDAYQSSSNYSVICHYGNLPPYTDVARVIFAAEPGFEEQAVVQDTGSSVRLQVHECVSDWPMTAWLPLSPFGTSTHRIQLSVERSLDGTTWERAEATMPVEGRVDLQAFGFISNRTYRRLALASIYRGLAASTARNLNRNRRPDSD